MRPELVLMRVLHQRRPPYPEFEACGCPSPLHRDSQRSFTGVAHWDPNRAFHLGVIANEGILQTYTLEFQEGGASYTLSPASAYQLHLLYGEDLPPVKELTVRGYNSLKLRTKPVDVQLGSFEFIPGRPDEILFFQLNSSRILFARLPVGCSGTGGSNTEKTSKVFCIGSHSVSIVCISVRSDGLAMLSAASDGSIRVWRLSDGTMLCETAMSDAHPENAQLSYLDRESKRTCGFCGEVLQDMWIYAKLLLFVGQTWELAMGCLDGLLRFWTKTSEGLPPNNSVGGLELLFTESLFSSSEASISALAVHSPDFEGVIGSHLAAAKEGAGFQALPLFQGALSPIQQQEEAFQPDGVVQDDSPRGMQNHDLSSPSFSKEYMAAGTTEGGLMVWARYAGSHGWARTWSRISADVSIVCLSFRADGGLLAAGASVLAIPSPETAIQGSSGELVDRVHLYETSSWSCVGTLNFHSRLGSCSFYKPIFVEEGVEKEWKLALGMLLVCTSDGPETHLVPDFYSPPNDGSCKRNVSKSVRWADTEEGRLHTSLASPTFSQHFGDYEGDHLLIQETRSMERNINHVDNDADVDKPPSQLANPSDCNGKSVTGMKCDKSRRNILEKGGKTRKEVPKPEWDSSVAKIEVGMKMDFISKEEERKDPHFTRLKGGRGHQDAHSGSKRKECRLNSLNGQSEEHMPQVAEDNGLEEESCRLCSHPLSDHSGLASGHVTMQARQTLNAVNMRSDDAEESNQGSRWTHIQETPAVPQDEERERNLHTNMCNQKNNDSFHHVSSFDPNQSEEGASRNLCHEKLGDHPNKVIANPKNCFKSSTLVAETQGESYQTPVLDQAQDAPKSRGCENEMSCHSHSKSTVAEQENHGAGYVSDMKERYEDTAGSQGLTNESQEVQKGRPLRSIVPDNCAPELQEHMVTAKQPRSPSSLPTGGSTHQNKAHSQHMKLGQAPSPRSFSCKENRTGDEQRMSLQHAAGKSTKICSVCDTPIQEKHLHDHSRMCSEVHSMSATYYENHHLINKCSICSTPTKHQHQHQHQHQQQEDLHWWRESTTSGVEYTNVQEKSWSWNHNCHEKDVERACQEMCEHFQMRTENDAHQRMPSGSSGNIFEREFVEYQASLLAHYAKSHANKRSYREVCRSCHHSMFNHEGQQNETQEDGNGRSHQQHPRGFRITKPMSGCQSDQSMALENFPAELIQGFRMGKRIWPLHTKREVCVGCSRPGSKRFQETCPHHFNEEAYRMLTISRFKPKLLEEKKLHFCTGLHRGKGEIMPAPPKRRVLPVVSLSRDRQKGVWSRKENRKEWGSGHRGCCSQHWVSLLETSKRVCHTEGCHGDRGCNRSTDSTMTPDVVATLKITKFQAVRGGKFQPNHAMRMDDRVTTSVGFRGSFHGKTRPQSAAGMLRHMDSGSTTPRSVSSCGGARKSIAVTPAAKLVSPELNSSAWILAKVEELHKEPFTGSKALQVAKEHGFVLNEEDEAELKHYLRDTKKHLTVDVDPRLLEAERQEKRTREKYIDLSSINAPPPLTKGNVAPRKVSKQVDKEVGARRKSMPAISDLWVGSDQCPQVCSKGNFNLTQLDMEQEESEEARIWAERESACREVLSSMAVYDSCCM